jgi:predicted acyltransferase (DUF342 family)
MATVKFLTGKESDLLKRVGGLPENDYVNPVVEGSLYVTAEPDLLGTWKSAIYYDTQGQRIKVSGGGGGGSSANENLFAHTIHFDGVTSSGTTVVTTLRNINKTDYYNINFPAASDTSAGIITTDTQTLTGDKIFNANGSLTIQKNNGFNYSGLSQSSDDVARTVWFSHADHPGIPVKHDGFKINPASKDAWTAILTNTSDKTASATGYTKLIVDVVQGIAAEAYADDKGNQISKKYMNKIEFDGSTGSKVTYFTYDGSGAIMQTPANSPIPIDFPTASDKSAGVVTTSAQTIAGDKTFTGKIYINNSDDAVSGTSGSGALIIGDKTKNHIVIDSDEIMAKSDASTSGTLYLQNEGGATNIGSTLDVTGATTLKNTLEVTGGAQLKQTLTVEGINYFNNATAATGKNTGAVQVKGGISVNGASYFDADVTFNGSLTMNNNLTVKKNVSIDGTLTVGGATTLKDVLEVQKKATLKDVLEVIGATVLKSTLSVDGATTLNSTLGVTGKTTLSDELDVVKGAMFQSDINVQGIGKFNKNEPADNTGNTGSVRVTGGIYVGNTSYFKGDVTFGKAVEIIGAATLTGGVKGDLVMLTGDSSIYWNDNGVYRQRIKSYDTSATNDAVFKFQESSDSGASFKDLLAIRDDAVIVLTKNTGRLTKLYDESSELPAISIGSNNKNINAIRIGHTTDGNSFSSGFSIKYTGEEAGVDNNLEIHADGNGGKPAEENLSMSINQISEIGLGTTPASGYRLNVNGKVKVTGNAEATSANTGQVQVTGGIAVSSNSWFGGDVILEGGIYIGNTTAADAILYLNNKVALKGIDKWLRVNDVGDFTSGVYFGSSVTRTDGQFQVGENGSQFYANSSGNAYISNTLGIAGTNTAYKLYVKGNSFLEGTTYLGQTDFYVNGAGDAKLNRVGINGTNTAYRLYVNGTSYFVDDLYFNEDEVYQIDKDGNGKFKLAILGTDDDEEVPISDATGKYALYVIKDSLLDGDLYLYKENATITWNNGTYRSRIYTKTGAGTTIPANTDAVFKFQGSTDSGSNYGDLLAIRKDAMVVLTKNTGRLTKVYDTASTVPAIAIGSADKDITILRAGQSSDAETFKGGYSLKYIGTGANTDKTLNLYADGLVTSGTSPGENLSISVNQISEIGLGAAPSSGYRLYSNGKVKITSGEAAVSCATTDATNSAKGALHVTGGIRASANSHFGGWVNAASGLGVYQSTGTGTGISLYNGTDGGVPTYGIMLAKTANFGTIGSISSDDWATYFTMSNTNNRGWIFRRQVANGKDAGVHNIVGIDTYGNIYSQWNGATGVLHRVQNTVTVNSTSKNCSVSLYTAASGNRGIYDHTTSTWMIYAAASDDKVHVVNNLYLDSALYAKNIYPLDNDKYFIGSTSKRYKTLYLSELGTNETYGNINTNLSTTSHILGNKGRAIINSTSKAEYVILARMKSTNGVWTLGSHKAAFNLYYTTDEIVTAGTNSVTKYVTLLNESGNSSFPGNVSIAGTLAITGGITKSITITRNGATKTVYNGSADVSDAFYAPTASGTAGQYLRSGGASKTPAWSDVIKIQVLTADPGAPEVGQMWINTSA